MTLVKLFNFILFLTFFHNILNGQKELRVGYINMEYILSNIEDFEVANKEFEYKIDQWKKEISKKETQIKIKREELEFEKDLIPNQIYLCPLCNPTRVCCLYGQRNAKNQNAAAKMVV